MGDAIIRMAHVGFSLFRGSANFLERWWIRREASN
jgi:hypothetical protein